MWARMVPNHRTAVPRNHIVVDTETVPVPIPGERSVCVHKLMLGCMSAFRWRNGKATSQSAAVFKDYNTFWNHVATRLSASAPLWVWAHNAAFDLGSLQFWRLLECGEYSLEDTRPPAPSRSRPGQERKRWKGWACTDDPPTILKLMHRNGCRVNIVDTMNWCPVSLAKIAEWLDMEKPPLPGELGSEEDWVKRCESDVAITQRLVERLLSIVGGSDCGNFKPTVAAQSAALWRHITPPGSVVYHDDAEIKELERDAYYGGRSLLYYQGRVLPVGLAGLERLAGCTDELPVLHGGPVYALDCTSAYPSAMVSGPYPVCLSTVLRDCPVSRLRSCLGSNCVVADVQLSAHSEPYPVRRASGTVWATGRFRASLCGPELARALESGHITHCHRAALYQQGDPFRAFVDKGWAHLAQAKANGDPLGAKLWKLMLNALHGKLAQQSPRWQTLHGQVAPIPWGTYVKTCPETGRPVLYRSLAGVPQMRLDSAEPLLSSPSLSAYVTSYARERMRSLRLTAGVSDTLYEDADCLHVTSVGFERLLQSAEVSEGSLGKLHVERVADTALYLGPHDYRHGQYMVCRGLARGATEEEGGMWRQTEWHKLDALLVAGCPPGPVCYERLIPRPAHPVRGRVRPDGWVEPLEIR